MALLNLHLWLIHTLSNTNEAIRLLVIRRPHIVLDFDPVICLGSQNA